MAVLAAALPRIIIDLFIFALTHVSAQYTSAPQPILISDRKYLLPAVLL
jgi:hypothetical protein